MDPCVPETPFQTQVPSFAPEALSRPLTSRPKPHVPCPGTTCPAEGTPAPLDQFQWLLFLPSPFCDYQEQRTLPSPLSAQRVLVEQPAPAHLALFHLGSGPQIF